MDENNPYSILGVSENASQDEIKKAFRLKARDLHPDVNKNNKAKENEFKKVSEAYEVLSDEKKKNEYDFRKSHPHASFTFTGSGGDPRQFFGQVKILIIFTV